MPTGPSDPTTGWQVPAEHVPDPERPFVIAGVGTRLVAWLVDLLILGAISALALIAIAVATQSAFPDDLMTIDLTFAVLVTGLQFLYFVGFWTSSGGATPGMRLVALRVVAVSGGDGGLAIAPAIIRWAAFGYPLTLLTVLEDVSQIASWGLTAWSVVLLLTTIISDTNQGIHDRLAGSAVMQRSGVAVKGALVGCIVAAMVLLVLFVLLPIAALALLGDQLELILSEVGQSI
ncbi:MAG: RDD family protein [Chloroflexota bacterium]